MSWRFYPFTQMPRGLDLEFTLLLLGSTLLFCFLGGLIWYRTRNAGFALGLFFLYYWSLYGAWAIVTDLSGGQSGKRYQYLYDKLFFIYLDGDYFLSLVYYSLFLILVAVMVLAVAGTAKKRLPSKTKAIEIFPWRMILGGATALLVSFLLIRDQLAYAMLMGMSGYQVTASGEELGALFILHQAFTVIAVLPAAIGIAVAASGQDGLFLKSRHDPSIMVGYLLFAGALFGYGMLMGNKDELFWGMILSVTLYLVNARRPRFWRLSIWGATAFAAIAVIDFIRTLAIADLTQGFAWHDAVDTVTGITSSNEAFGAHFSLYGILHYDVPLTYGSSVVSLVASLVPRVFWADRPPTVYGHYADTVGALPDQGYTIHHAAGWYLNFGFWGVVVGAVVFGLIWGLLFRGIMVHSARNSTWKAVFCALGFAGFTGGIPDLIRIGLEGYKAIILYSIFVPFVMVKLASISWGSRATGGLEEHGG